MRSSCVIVSVLLVACAGDARNPPVLWLGLDGAETHATLLDHEPPPF